MQNLLATKGASRLADRLKHVSLLAVVATSSVGAAAAPLFLSSAASAQAKTVASNTSTSSTVVVTPSNLQGWTNASDGSTAKVDYVADSSAPLEAGALQLSVPGNDDEAEFDRNVTPALLSSIKNFGYDAKKVSGDPSYVSPAYVLGIDLTGTAKNTDKDFYAFFEPVYNNVTDLSSWQHFTIDPAASKFWSFSKLGDSATKGGANGANLFTLNDVAQAFPNAKVNELTLNLGSGTPGWAAEADNITLGNTTWDVEPTIAPSTKDDCKNNGWQNFNTPTPKNQGQCVSYVEAHSTIAHGGLVFTAGDTANRHVWFYANSADNNGWYVYADKTGWYGAKISSVKADGNTVWLAGKVDRSSVADWKNYWLFAKVVDGKPDQISASFVTTQTEALNGVSTKADPHDGPFTLDRGNITVTQRHNR